MPAHADEQKTTGAVSAGISSKKQFSDGYTSDPKGRANPVADLGVNMTHLLGEHVDLNGCLVTFVDVTGQGYRDYINETDVCMSVTAHSEIGPLTLYADLGGEFWWQDVISYDGKAVIAKMTPGVKAILGELGGQHVLEVNAKFERVETLNHDGGGYRVTPKAVYTFGEIGGTHFGFSAEGGAFVPIAGRPYGREHTNAFIGGGMSYAFEDVPFVFETRIGHIFAFSANEGKASTAVRFGISVPFSF